MDANTERLRARLGKLGISDEQVNSDDTVIDQPCMTCQQRGVSIRVEDAQASVRCVEGAQDCELRDEPVALETWLDWVESLRVTPAMATQRAVANGGQVLDFHRTTQVVRERADEAEPAERPADKPRPQRRTPHISTNETQVQKSAETQRRGLGETLIIALLALIFLAAGLLAAAMSGFANYQAFGAMVDDPLQSRVWAWTGIIASICSFGGFTFVYWHGANRRFKEAARVALFALAGAGTSLIGTQMYMAGTANERVEAAAIADARTGVLEAQIDDWRAQIAGIPADTRSIEGLEAYISEVERVGRTNEKPYRDALDELGQARRRADLQGRIDAARLELGELAVASVGGDNDPLAQPFMPWFIAGMMEVFSSQGTSIGFVALMILAGRRRDEPH